MYVCMYVCIYTHRHIPIHTHTHTHTSVPCIYTKSHSYLRITISLEFDIQYFESGN
jgi:hypothetical protein